MNISFWMQNSPLCAQETHYLCKNLLNEFNLNTVLTEFEVKILNNALKMRMQNVPLAKIVQKKEFFKHSFITTFKTLDPRPETEFLVEKALSLSQKPRSIIDIGTGTGCIILSLIKEFPKAKGIAVDICSEALKICELNAHKLNVHKRLKFVKNNFTQNMSETCDLVISNPPYITNKELMNADAFFDPSVALFGNEETYSNLIENLKGIKFKNLILEVPENLTSFTLNCLKETYPTFQLTCQEIYDSKIHCIYAFEMVK